MSIGIAFVCMRALYDYDCVYPTAGEFTLIEIFLLMFSHIGITGSKYGVELPNE